MNSPAAASPGSQEEFRKAYPADLSTKDRIMGSIIGTLVGDALGVGCHWYYDLDRLRREFGTWISYYVEPRVDSDNPWVQVARQRHKVGVRAGDVSQTGQLVITLLESVAEKGRYDPVDLTARVDAFFKTLNGGAFSGRYSDQAVRETWRKRHKGIDWSSPEIGSIAVTSEAAQMGVILACLYHRNPQDVATAVNQNARFFYQNPFAICQSAGYCLNVAGFVNAVPLEDIRSYALSIPHALRAQLIPYPDSISQIETGAAVAWGPEITFGPPALISKVYGAHCEIQQLLPAAYYLIHRYPDDFEMAVLSAINGGGNNMARAALTGGMSGAMNGCSGIPRRLLEGLKDHDRLLALAERIADLSEK